MVPTAPQFSDSFGCPVDVDLHVGGHAVEVLEHGEQFKDLGLADDVVHAHLGVVHPDVSLWSRTRNRSSRVLACTVSVAMRTFLMPWSVL